VTAPLLHPQKGHVVLACQTILTSLPPAGCSGVRVRGYDFSRLRHVTRIGRAWWTGPVVLVGTWDGRALTLTRRPVAASTRFGSGDGTPARCHGQGPRAIKRLGTGIARDHARLRLMTLLACGSKVWIEVAVKDRATVRFVRERFGRAVLIRGWLHSVPR